MFGHYSRGLLWYNMPCLSLTQLKAATQSLCECSQERIPLCHLRDCPQSCSLHGEELQGGEGQAELCMLCRDSELSQPWLCAHPPSHPDFLPVSGTAADAQQVTALHCWASPPPKFPASPEPPAPITPVHLSLAFPHTSFSVSFFFMV